MTFCRPYYQHKFK